MQSLEITSKGSWYCSPEFVEDIDPHIVMIHKDTTSEGEMLIIRFTNGFGVKILRLLVAVEPPSLFVVMVLRFHGARMKDYKLAQYSPIPEVNWLDVQEDIVTLCRQVAVLPSHTRH